MDGEGSGRPVIQFADESNKRRCGGCTLCCKVLPQKELNKPAGQRCKYQRTGKGCSIYARRPPSCRIWNCIWLGGDVGTERLSRPDRAGYVLDILPDYVTIREDETGREGTVPVVQVWIDPARPNAHRDPELRAYLAMRAERDGYAAIIRFDSNRSMGLFAPAVSADGQWHEVWTGQTDQEHSFAQVMSALTGRPVAVPSVEEKRNVHDPIGNEDEAANPGKVAAALAEDDLGGAGDIHRKRDHDDALAALREGGRPSPRRV